MLVQRLGPRVGPEVRQLVGPEVDPEEGPLVGPEVDPEVGPLVRPEVRPEISPVSRKITGFIRITSSVSCCVGLATRVDVGKL